MTTVDDPVCEQIGHLSKKMSPDVSAMIITQFWVQWACGGTSVIKVLHKKITSSRTTESKKPLRGLFRLKTVNYFKLKHLLNILNAFVIIICLILKR